MVIESSDQSVGFGAERHQMFVEVETASDALQLSKREPALSVWLERGLELKINHHTGVEFAASLIERLENPIPSHRIWLEAGAKLEGGAR